MLALLDNDMPSASQIPLQMVMVIGDKYSYNNTGHKYKRKGRNGVTDGFISYGIGLSRRRETGLPPRNDKSTPRSLEAIPCEEELCSRYEEFRRQYKAFLCRQDEKQNLDGQENVDGLRRSLQLRESEKDFQISKYKDFCGQYEYFHDQYKKIFEGKVNVNRFYIYICGSLPDERDFGHKYEKFCHEYEEFCHEYKEFRRRQDKYDRKRLREFVKPYYLRDPTVEQKTRLLILLEKHAKEINLTYKEMLDELQKKYQRYEARYNARSEIDGKWSKSYKKQRTRRHFDRMHDYRVVEALLSEIVTTSFGRICKDLRQGKLSDYRYGYSGRCLSTDSEKEIKKMLDFKADVE